MAYQPATGSVVGFQSDPTKLVATVSVASIVPSSVYVVNPVSVLSVTPSGNQSVSGTVGASVIGHSPVVIVGGSILTSSTANQSVSGAVQIAGKSPDSILSVGRIDGGLSGSTMGIATETVIFGEDTSTPGVYVPVKVGPSGVLEVGANQEGTWRVSIAGTVPVTVSGNPSISGTVQVGNFPTTQNVSGSVAAWLQSTNASIITVGAAAANQSVSGTVGASVIGHAPVVIVGGSILTSSTANQSVSGTVDVGNFPTTQNVSGSVIARNIIPSSMLVGASIIGLPPVNVTNFPTNQNVSGSVAAWLQSTNASVITVGTAAANQSVSGTVGASVIGTVPVTQSGTVISSISGGAVSVIGSVPIQGSVTGLSDGRLIIKPLAPTENEFRAVASVTSTSVTAIKTSAAGVSAYVTDIWLTNTGSSTTLVTVLDGSTSIMGRFIAPAGGGTASPGITIPLKATAAQDLSFQAGTATSILYVTMNGYTR